MKTSSSISPSIRQAAAKWLGLRDAGLTAAQETEFLTWLETDERHAIAFGEIDRAWSRLDRLETGRPPAGEPDPDLLFRDAGEIRPAPQRRGRRWNPIFSVGLAAAAALIIGFVGWWRPMIVARAANYTTAAATEIGASRKLALPDGSVVRLNTDTQLEVAFTPGERRVRLLRGEAHFAVAKNPARPFVVSTAAIDVRAVGTAFNVRLDAAAVEVLVTEGKVRVDEAASGRNLLIQDVASLSVSESRDDHPNAERLLTRGERATIALTVTATAATIMTVAPKPAAIASIAPEESARVLAWQHERLEFAATPMAEAVAQFNRYNRHKLVIGDRRLRELTFGGTFRCDGYDAFVRLLESHFGVVAERRDAETILRLGP